MAVLFLQFPFLGESCLTDSFYGDYFISRVEENGSSRDVNRFFRKFLRSDSVQPASELMSLAFSMIDYNPDARPSYEEIEESNLMQKMRKQADESQLV